MGLSKRDLIIRLLEIGVSFSKEELNKFSKDELLELLDEYNPSEYFEND